MKQFKINGKIYNVKSEYKDFTYKQFEAVCEILNNWPDFLKQFYDISVKNPAPFTTKQNIVEVPTEIGKLICACSDITDEIMKQIHGEDRKLIFLNSLIWLPYSVFSKSFYKLNDNLELELYSPNVIEKVKLGKSVHELPKNEKIFGVDIPLKKMTAKTFCEASDFELMVAESKIKGSRDMVIAGDFTHLPMITALLTTYPFNEHNVLMQNEFAKDLSMNILIDVFFYLEIQFVSLQIDARNCLQKVEVVDQKSASVSCSTKLQKKECSQKKTKRHSKVSRS